MASMTSSSPPSPRSPPTRAACARERAHPSRATASPARTPRRPRRRPSPRRGGAATAELGGDVLHTARTARALRLLGRRLGRRRDRGFARARRRRRRRLEPLGEPLPPVEAPLAREQRRRGQAGGSVHEVVVHVVEPRAARELDHLVRRREAVRLATGPAVAAGDAPVAARAAAPGALPNPARNRRVDVLAVPVPEAHPAKREGRASALSARLRGAEDVRLHRLLAAPVARHAQLAVVHARAHGETAPREVAVGQLRQFRFLSAGRRRAASPRRRDVLLVVQAVLLRVVDRDALAAGAATLALRHDDPDAGLALRDGERDET